MSEAPEGIPPMVHAVAEALRADCLRTFGATWSYDVSWAFARAAIEAMRDPTAGMVNAGGYACQAHCDLTMDAARASWAGMIDAALAEPTASR